MASTTLLSWDSAVANVRHLGNQVIAYHGQTLEYSLADLDTEIRHHFKFNDVLGFRHQHGFNLQRVGNSFIVEPSDWLVSMQSGPFRTRQP